MGKMHPRKKRPKVINICMTKADVVKFMLLRVSFLMFWGFCPMLFRLFLNG